MPCPYGYPLRVPVQGRRTMAVKQGQVLPRTVTLACGVHGIRHAEVRDYVVGTEFVTVIDTRGHRHTMELARLRAGASPAPTDAIVGASLADAR